MLFKGTRTLSGAPVVVGRDEGDRDIFIELSTGGVEARFVQPTNELSLIKQSDSLQIMGLGSATTGNLQLSLFEDDQLIEQTSNDTITYVFKPINNQEQVSFSLIAENGQGLSDTTTIRVVVRPDELSTTLGRHKPRMVFKAFPTAPFLYLYSPLIKILFMY